MGLGSAEISEMHLLRLLIAASSRLAMPTVTLNNGVIMPQLSAGTGGYDNASAAAAIRTAFDAGIFAFHSANDYGNLKGVKDGLDYAKDAGGRDALFVTAMTSPCIHASPPMRNVSDAGVLRAHHTRTERDARDACSRTHGETAGSRGCFTSKPKDGSDGQPHRRCCPRLQ